MSVGVYNIQFHQSFWKKNAVSFPEAWSFHNIKPLDLQILTSLAKLDAAIAAYGPGTQSSADWQRSGASRVDQAQFKPAFIGVETDA